MLLLAWTLMSEASCVVYNWYFWKYDLPHTVTHAREETAYFVCFWYHILKEERWQVLIGLRPARLFASPVSVCLPASASCLLGLLRIYEKELHLINRLDGCLIKWQFNFYELVSCKGSSLFLPVEQTDGYQVRRIFSGVPWANWKYILFFFFF